MPDLHANFGVSLVATAPSPATSGTSLVVTAADGAKFPAVPFNATIWPASSQPTTANAEIVRVTARATDTLTITRAQEGSTARTVVVGDQIAATITAKTLTDAEGSGPAYVGVKVYRSASYTLVNAAVTPVPWDAEEWDSDSFHDNTTNNTRLIVPSGKDGRYRATLNIGTDTSCTPARFFISLAKNGTVIRGGNAEIGLAQAGYPMISISCEVDLVATDYVTGTYYNGLGGGGTMNMYLSQCAMSLTKIG